MYPTIITPSSPAPTVRKLNQYGWPIIYNSAATKVALNITGNIIAIAKCLLNIIPKQASTVAAVPNKISRVAIGENALAIKHPNDKPIEYLLLKKQKSTNISEILN